MLHFKSFIIIILYFALCSALIWQSLKERPAILISHQGAKKQQVQSYFEDIYYYQKDKNKPLVILKANKLNIEQGNIKTIKPVGKIYFSNNRYAHYQAKNGFYDKKKKKITLKNQVHFYNKELDMKCSQGFFYTTAKKAQCEGRVRTQIKNFKNGDQLFVNAGKLNMWWEREYLEFSQNVQGRVKRKFPFEPGVIFSSDQLSLYKKELKAQLTGQVNFKYEGIYSQSQRAELFLDNYNKKLKYYMLYDDIKVEQKIMQEDGQYLTRKAHSEVLEAFTKERKVVLKGAPRVSQGQDLTRGYKITLFLDKEIMEVDGASSVIEIKK